VIVVLERGSSAAEIAEVLSALERRGLEGQVLDNRERPLIHITSGPTRLARKVARMRRVEGLIPTSGPRVRRQGRRLFPYYTLQLTAALVALIGLLVFLSGLFPPGIGAPVDLQGEPVPAAYPWYVRGPLALAALFPRDLAWVGYLCVLVLMAAVLLLPVLDRTRGETPRSRKLVLTIGLAVLAGWCFLSIWGPTA